MHAPTLLPSRPRCIGVLRDFSKAPSPSDLSSRVGYRGLREYKRRVVNHSAKQYVRGDVHTNGIESFWALFKRGYHGVYHQMSKKHLQRYINEYAFRLNRKGQSMQDIFSDLVARITESTKLPYKELTA